MKWTLDDLKKTKAAAINPHVTGAKKQEKKSRFRSVKCEYDGHSFDSIKEKDRYIELRFQEKVGVIRELKLQVPFELNDGGKFSMKYVSDFAYVVADTKEFVVEDVKGVQTQMFKQKKKLMKKVHGIVIKIT